MSERVVLKNRVRELRSRLEMRQSDLAREMGVTRQTVLAIEKERLNPSVHTALKIARVLREPLDYVFYLEPVSHSASIAVAQGDHARAGPFDNRASTWELFWF